MVTLRAADIKCELFHNGEYKVVAIKDYLDEIIAHKDDLSDYDGDIIRVYYYDYSASYGLKHFEYTPRELLALYENVLTEQMTLF